MSIYQPQHRTQHAQPQQQSQEQIHHPLPERQELDARIAFVSRLHAFHKGDSAGYCDRPHETEREAREWARLRSSEMSGEIEIFAVRPTPHIIARYSEGKELTLAA